jgi:alanine racemase
MKWHRPTVAEINLTHFHHNIMLIKRKIGPERKILIAVKANAYGHGLVKISRYAQKNLPIDFLGVAIPGEGITLREAGIKLPILVFGGLFSADIPFLFEYNLTPTVINRDIASLLNEEADKRKTVWPVHVNVDTGMGRIGFYHKEAFSHITWLHSLPWLKIEGIYSHFPVSDSKDKTFSFKQIELLKNLVMKLKKSGIEIPIVHCSNSGAIIDLSEGFFDMVRPGIMIYGLYPSPFVDHHFGLREVMRLRTKIVFIKKVNAGRSISYGQTYTPKEDTIIATIPLGYGDGYNRLLSNKGNVLVRGKRAPVVGRVTMDQILIDLGKHPEKDDIQIGEEVVLFGKQREEEISIEEVANQLNTIPYEVTCWINSRVPHIYI